MGPRTQSCERPTLTGFKKEIVFDFYTETTISKVGVNKAKVSGLQFDKFIQKPAMSHIEEHFFSTTALLIISLLL